VYWHISFLTVHWPSVCVSFHYITLWCVRYAPFAWPWLAVTWPVLYGEYLTNAQGEDGKLLCSITTLYLSQYVYSFSILIWSPSPHRYPPQTLIYSSIFIAWIMQ
jgi:hypothetical protein